MEFSWKCCGCLDRGDKAYADKADKARWGGFGKC